MGQTGNIQKDTILSTIIRHDTLFDRFENRCPCLKDRGVESHPLYHYWPSIDTMFRLAANVGEVNATLILEKEWGHETPQKVIEAGLLQKARFARMS